MSVKEAAEFYHDGPLISDAALRNLLDRNIAQFVLRETDNNCDVVASDYYRQNWKTSRLHFLKGHPLPDVTRHFTATLADRLGIVDFDPTRTLGLPGPHQFCLPIRRWVKAGLDLTFDDQEFQVSCNANLMSLSDFIKNIYEWYDSRGHAEVVRRLEPLPAYRTALAACGRLEIGRASWWGTVYI